MVQVTPTSQEQTHQDTFVSDIKSGRDVEYLKSCLKSQNVSVHFPHSFTQQTPLSTAAMCNETAAMELLIAHNAQVDDVDANGYIPLHWAAAAGSKFATELLLQHGADPTITDRHGRRAFNMAQDNHHLELAEFLKIASKKFN